MHQLYTSTLFFPTIPCTAMSNVVYHIKMLQKKKERKKKKKKKKPGHLVNFGELVGPETLCTALPTFY